MSERINFINMIFYFQTKMSVCIHFLFVKMAAHVRTRMGHIDVYVHQRGPEKIVQQVNKCFPIPKENSIKTYDWYCSSSYKWVWSLGDALVVWCGGKRSSTCSFQERWLENYQPSKKDIACIYERFIIVYIVNINLFSNILKLSVCFLYIFDLKKKTTVYNFL